MIALYIILGILLFVALLLLMRASLVVEYAEELKIYASILGIRFRFLPAKKKKYRLSHYSDKQIQKRLEKEQRKKAKKAAKQKHEPSSEAKGEASGGILERLGEVTKIIKIILGRFSKHVKIKFSRLNINVATGNAASTALLYGAVTQGVAYLLEILDTVTNINAPQVNINADFLSEKTTSDVKVKISLRVWQILDIGLRGLFGFLRLKK